VRGERLGLCIETAVVGRLSRQGSAKARSRRGGPQLGGSRLLGEEVDRQGDPVAEPGLGGEDVGPVRADPAQLVAEGAGRAFGGRPELRRQRLANSSRASAASGRGSTRARPATAPGAIVRQGPLTELSLD